MIAQPTLQYPTAFAKTQQAILEECAVRTAAAISFGESLLSLPAKQLNARPAEDAWSALECVAHLNDYADMYLAQLQQRSAKAPPRRQEKYAPGLLGKRLALAMHPNRRDKKMRSPSHTNHLHADLDAALLDAFLVHLRGYQKVIQQLRGKSIRGSRVPFSLTPLVRFHLGDILMCLVWHNARHIDQATEALSLTEAKVR